MKTFNEFISSFSEQTLFDSFAESVVESQMHPAYVFGVIIENLIASTDDMRIKTRLADIEEEICEGFWDNWKKNGLGSYTRPITYGLGTAIGGLKQGWNDAKAAYAPQQQPQNSTATPPPLPQQAQADAQTQAAAQQAPVLAPGQAQTGVQGDATLGKVQNAMKLLSGRVLALGDSPLKQSMLKMIADIDQQMKTPPQPVLSPQNQQVAQQPNTAVYPLKRQRA